jgi:hypothetical protein
MFLEFNKILSNFTKEDNLLQMVISKWNQADFKEKNIIITQLHFKVTHLSIDL